MQAATSVRRLRPVKAMRFPVAVRPDAILGISALIEDIKSGYSVDPLASRELDRCLKETPLQDSPYLP